jgi:hypothetical protein
MQYTGLYGLAPWKTQQDHIDASIVGTLCHKQGSWKRTPLLQAKQDWDALLLLRRSDGNVSCLGIGLYHHARWSSNAFLHYIRKQVEQFLWHVAKQMLMFQLFE